MSLRDFLFYEEPGITLYCGDCREVLPLLVPPDLLVADPPYGISYSPGGGGNGWCPKTFIGTDIVRGDDKPFDPTHLRIWATRLVLFGANHYANLLPPSPSWIIWDKRDEHPSNEFGDAELAWTNLGGPVRVFRHLWNGAFRASERGITRDHPTQKPEALMAWIITSWTDLGQRVADPYMGSGTTIVAAKNLGRRAIGIEIEPKYCEIAVKRLRQEVLTFPT